MGSGNLLLHYSVPGSLHAVKICQAWDHREQVPALVALLGKTPGGAAAALVLLGEHLGPAHAAKVAAHLGSSRVETRVAALEVRGAGRVPAPFFLEYLGVWRLGCF